MTNDTGAPVITDVQARELDETRRLLYVAIAGRDLYNGNGQLDVHRAKLQGTLVNRLRHCHDLDNDKADDLERWVGYLVIRRVGADIDELGLMWGRDMIAKISATLEARVPVDAGS